MFEQLRSWRHAFSLTLSERLRSSRGPYRQTPAGRLEGLDVGQQLRVEALQTRYDARFEASLDAQTALRNYEYLDMLEHAFGAAAIPVPQPRVLCDAGCASFWYSAALLAFFRPGRLIGVEVEGYRRLRGGHTRIDYARGYLEAAGQGEFVVADYRRYTQPADLITSFFPFLTRHSILAWRLPLSLLDPGAFFAQVSANLRPGGLFFMVNHGLAEAHLAHERCVAANLRRVVHLEEAGPLSRYRSSPAEVSLWQPI